MALLQKQDTDKRSISTGNAFNDWDSKVAQIGGAGTHIQRANVSIMKVWDKSASEPGKLQPISTEEEKTLKDIFGTRQLKRGGDFFFLAVCSH